PPPPRGGGPRAPRLRARVRGRAGGRPRQRRQRAAQPPPRDATLMAAVVWAMMGLALWHFTIFVPDRCCAGLAGSRAGAVIAPLLFGFLVHGLTVPGRNDTDLINALEAI